MVEKDPRDFEAGRQMLGERLHAESFGGVMAAVEDVEAKILSHGIGPMRTLAGNEGIHAFLGSGFEVAARAAGDDANTAANFRTCRNDKHLATDSASQTTGQLFTGDGCFALKTNELAVVGQKWPQIL